MAAQFLQAASGRVALGRELGRGGEGAVFEISDQPELVAKIYHSAPPPEKADKLLAMLQIATPKVLSLTAWPRDVLRGPDGRVQGLLMSKIAGYKDIHSLYGPKSRRAEFPDANWKHLIHAAANVARAFAVLHEVGCVIGDVNHGGIRVATDMTVKLIDCDSFQIQDGGRTYFCEVGVENFTPPELQGRSFRGVARSPNHDNFGLAVMVFYLLMIGRHPFAGRYSGKGEMPIEKAIAEHRYAYGRNATATLMEPPPLAPRALIVSSDVANLWERAFSATAAQGSGRPSALEWVKCLSALEQIVARCAQHPGHYHLTTAGACPWCAIESSSGVLLFFAPSGTLPSPGTFNLAIAWSRIGQVPQPGPVPEITLPTVQASATVAVLKKSQLTRAIVGRSVVVIALLIALALSHGNVLWLIAAVGGWICVGRWVKSERQAESLRHKRQEAEGVLSQLRDRLQADTDPQRFAQRLKILEGKRAELLNLPAVREGRLKELVRDREKYARHRFLEGFKIEHAKIPGIGPAKRTMLESYNIETADDINRSAILDVPGFGPALATRLEDWRRSVEIRFRFNPNAAVEPRDIQELDRKTAQERSTLEHVLLQGANELSQIRQEIAQRRETLLTQAASVAADFAQADADWMALTGQA
jgi:DNA-binding helix-hairpin-helix protein with protein kinase domain